MISRTIVRVSVVRRIFVLKNHDEQRRHEDQEDDGYENKQRQPHVCSQPAVRLEARQQRRLAAHTARAVGAAGTTTAGTTTAKPHVIV